MGAIRKAFMSFGVTVLGLGIAFTIMAYDKPQVYPGLGELRAFAAEKLGLSPDQPPELTSLQHLRERSAPLPVEGQGPGAPIGGGTVYGILDVFRMKQIFRPNDAPTQTHRTRPGVRVNGPALPTVGETRKSNNSLLGAP
ncbi:hypothetical protein C8N43_3347 [Litoreibacter ponti]|uniref:Uncharacterized protein n=1 Tax=Litoreibacter ponti TaxID=1510457 RepID=A0A2T6BEN3_9RHOB|nr:hypothetical protein [Litoreibacter ponti]PTX54531.1 hypothetical protein C8N43_3347 [Litoreibacter ponti]